MQVQPSPFDSTHYGLRVGRLVREPGDGPGELAAAIDAARRDGCAVVFARLDDDDPLRDALDRAGHAPVDTLVTSTLGPEVPAIARTPAVAVEHHDRLGDPADVAAVAAITVESIRTSHLHADPRLPAARTHELYAAWARNDVTGRAQRTIVARSGAAPIGYLTVLAAPGTAAIDLVAVTSSWRGRGVGATLVASFIDWIAAREAGDGGRPIVASVGTQLDNPALRLYTRCGFVPAATHVTYHLWLDA